jgi:hypothetical protein
VPAQQGFEAAQVHDHTSVQGIQPVAAGAQQAEEADPQCAAGNGRYPDKIKIGLTASNLSKKPFTAKFSDCVLLDDKLKLEREFGE